MSGNWQDDALRRQLGIDADKPIAKGTSSIMGRSVDEKEIQRAGANGISAQDYKSFCSLFASGIQWVHENYPHVAGPRAVFFGNPGDTIRIQKPNGIAELVMQDNMTLARSQQDMDTYILIPYQKVRDFAQGTPSSFAAKARQGLGEHAANEVVFVDSVEEAYHSVQHQDLSLRRRLEQEEAQLNTLSPTDLLFSMDTDITSSTPIEEHDYLPRELDVVPVLEKALTEFRNKKQKPGPT